MLKHISWERKEAQVISTDVLFYSWIILVIFCLYPIPLSNHPSFGRNSNSFNFSSEFWSLGQMTKTTWKTPGTKHEGLVPRSNQDRKNDDRPAHHNRHFHSHDLNLLSYIHFCKTSSDTKKEILVVFKKMCNSVNWDNLSPRQIKSSYVFNWSPVFEMPVVTGTTH